MFAHIEYEGEYDSVEVVEVLVHPEVDEKSFVSLEEEFGQLVVNFREYCKEHGLKANTPKSRRAYWDTLGFNDKFPFRDFLKSKGFVRADFREW